MDTRFKAELKVSMDLILAVDPRQINCLKADG